MWSSHASCLLSIRSILADSPTSFPFSCNHCCASPCAVALLNLFYLLLKPIIRRVIVQLTKHKYTTIRNSNPISPFFPADLLSRLNVSVHPHIKVARPVLILSNKTPHGYPTFCVGTQRLVQKLQDASICACYLVTTRRFLQPETNYFALSEDISVDGPF